MAKGRKKPLHGAKKYSRLTMECSVAKCENEFFLCYPATRLTPSKRVCKEHWLKDETGA